MLQTSLLSSSLLQVMIFPKLGVHIFPYAVYVYTVLDYKINKNYMELSTGIIFIATSFHLT